MQENQSRSPEGASSPPEEEENWGEWEEPLKQAKGHGDPRSGGMRLGTKSPPSGGEGQRLQTPDWESGKDRESPHPTGSQSPHTPLVDVAGSKEGRGEVKSPPLATSTPKPGGGTPAKPGGSKIQVRLLLNFSCTIQGITVHVPFLQLDTLPREELIKYVKKQAQLLQKAKTRCAGEWLEQCNPPSLNPFATYFLPLSNTHV